MSESIFSDPPEPHPLPEQEEALLDAVTWMVEEGRELRRHAEALRDEVSAAVKQVASEASSAARSSVAAASREAVVDALSVVDSSVAALSKEREALAASARADRVADRAKIAELAGDVERMCGRARVDMAEALSALEKSLSDVRAERAALGWQKSVAPLLTAFAGLSVALVLAVVLGGGAWGWYSYKLAGLQAQVQSAKATVAALNKDGGRLILERCGGGGGKPSRPCIAVVTDGSGKPQIWRSKDGGHTFVIPEGY